MVIYVTKKLQIRDPLYKLITTVAFAVAVTLLYVSGIGCVYRALLGISCPGCGLTHALLALLRFDLAASLTYHPLLFTTPVLYLYYLFDGRMLGRVADRCVLGAILLAFLLRWIVHLFGSSL